MLLPFFQITYVLGFQIVLIIGAFIALIFILLHKPSESQVSNMFESKKSKTILFLIILVIALPFFLYVVFQQVRVEKQAAPAVPASQVSANPICTDITVQQFNGQEGTSFPSGTTVVLTGYCSTPAQNTLAVMEFTLHLPDKSSVRANFLPVSASEKNTNGKYFMKAVYPDVKLQQAGTYKIDLVGKSMQNQTSAPFSKTVTVTTSPIVQQPTSSPSVTCNTLSAVPSNGPTPLTVTLTAKANGNSIAGYTFTFGDGESQYISGKSSATTTHIYKKAGTFTSTVTVKDVNGAESSVTPLCSEEVIAGNTTPSQSIKVSPTPPLQTNVKTPTPTVIVLPSSGTSLPFIGLISLGVILVSVGFAFVL